MSKVAEAYPAEEDEHSGTQGFCLGLLTYFCCVMLFGVMAIIVLDWFMGWEGVWGRSTQ